MKGFLAFVLVGLFGLPFRAAAQSSLLWDDLMALPVKSQVRLLLQGGVRAQGEILSVTGDVIELQFREPTLLRAPEGVERNRDGTVWQFPKTLVIEAEILRVARYTRSTGATTLEISRIVKAIGLERHVEVESTSDQRCRGRIRQIDDTSFRVDCRNKALQQLPFEDVKTIRPLGMSGAVQGALIGSAVFGVLLLRGYSAAN